MGGSGGDNIVKDRFSWRNILSKGPEVSFFNDTEAHLKKKTMGQSLTFLIEGVVLWFSNIACGPELLKT